MGEVELLKDSQTRRCGLLDLLLKLCSDINYSTSWGVVFLSWHTMSQFVAAFLNLHGILSLHFDSLRLLELFSVECEVL